ncbi:MAG: MlaD family protein [Planctomycetota bacterium]|nr:MlaD family protein [Planctomycetota bacterium]
MESSSRRDFLLGLVFFGALALLLYYTIVLTGFSLQEKTQLTAWFPDARGLKEGDVVHVAGRPTGTVREVALDYDRPPDRRISVEMEFEEAPRLRQGYSLRIAEFSALGGRVVEIEPGVPGTAPIAPGAELIGVTSPPALEMLRELVEENREDLRAAIGNLRKVTDDITSGKGILGALVNDEGMRGDLERALADVRGLIDDVRAGKGALGALISDEATRDRLIALIEDTGAAMTDVREIARMAKEGEGLIGALLKDPQMKDDAARLLENLEITSERLRVFTDDAAAGKGLIGALLKDDELAANASSFLENLAEVSRRLKDGEGSLGRLLAQEEAYEELLKALKTLNAQLEDAREAQPVSTFAGMLFGSF